MSLVPANFDLHSVDFDALYQSGQMFEGVDLPSIPWDIGAAQPVVDFRKLGFVFGLDAEMRDAGAPTEAVNF